MQAENTRQDWVDHPDNDTPQTVAARFGRSLDWADMHVGPHRCVDGRRYVLSCLVSDPTCEKTAKAYLERDGDES